MQKYLCLGILVLSVGACSSKNAAPPPPPVTGAESGLQILSVSCKLSPLEVTWEAPAGAKGNYLVEKCDCAGRDDCCDPFMTVSCTGPTTCDAFAPFGEQALPGNLTRENRGAIQRFTYVDADSEMDLGYTMRVRSYSGTQFGPWLQAR